jgi:AraC-like DNA-binding protein
MYKIATPPNIFPEAIRSPTRAELWLPRPALSACVRAVIARDTRDVPLTPADRYNHFPATPVCSLLWYLSGDAEILPEAGRGTAAPSQPLPAAISFCGPSTQPIVTRNPGPMHAFMVLFLPDALAALTGIDPGAYLDRIVPAAPLFAADWQTLFQAVAAAPDDATRADLIEAFLLPRWQAQRPDAASPIRVYADWYQSLALRAATSGLGRSLRQVERRIKQWTGQPLRELRGMSRSEQAFFDAVVATENSRSGEVNWSEIASNHGYTDQSHLSRQTRRITGFPPEELRRRILREESFWVYRLWGFSAGG